ncbi:putative receptor-like protein kinase At4g00960 isoform X1 [Neltuma alba]|nr:putative receptor-like protein kinase At4g00960 isoform X1 [Prosopis alba]
MFDECMLSYSNTSILDNAVVFYMWDEHLARNWNQYNQVLMSLLRTLSSIAASGDSSLKFAAGHEEGPNLQTIYAVVQCTPNLSESECKSCLLWAISKIPERGKDRLAPPTLLSPPPSTNTTFSSPPPSAATRSSKGKKSQTIIALVVSTSAMVMLLIFAWICVRVRKQGRKSPNDSTELTEESIQFEFDTIKVATNNFSDENKLGQGGFGPVYKGMLFEGKEIAVKRLSSNSGQGDIEFKNEVQLMVRLQHRNLVRLLGFCLKQKERLLVYELLPNKSLDHFLFDPIRRAQLRWKTRYKIIGGIASGLLYLHEESQQRIVHRDLKASNILLDADMNPKISDFGMARLFVTDQTQANTDRVAGTYGYMAPEYARHGRFSTKSDVFSFGVLILEIVSGQKNGGFHNLENVEHLPSLAWKSWRKGKASNIIDPTLRDGSRNEIMRCLHIGLLCVQEKAADRPTLASLVLMLSSHSFSLQEPMKPAFFMNDTSLSGRNSRDYRAVSTSSSKKNSKSAESLSVNEASITDIYPR